MQEIVYEVTSVGEDGIDHMEAVKQPFITVETLISRICQIVLIGLVWFSLSSGA